MSLKPFSTALLATALISGPVSANSLSAEEQSMADWIDAHAEDAIALLEETVNISSGTMNHDGVREVGRVMRRELDALGLDAALELAVERHGLAERVAKTREEQAGEHGRGDG